MKYNKLVRDKIPEIIKSKGEAFKIHIASEEEFWLKLKEKLIEESEEFIKEGEQVEDLADILEIIDAICDFKKIDRQELEKIKNKKADERGKFKNKIILEES